MFINECFFSFCYVYKDSYIYMMKDVIILLNWIVVCIVLKKNVYDDKYYLINLYCIFRNNDIEIKY